ncbi:MAG: polysaccharide pyruvyl transferase CsaB [Candidatus Gastranaerophilales bacterium]|nr:polysaccharide pyruvyl transferase CsaB [Candidatus Gastranaerophilales bacterium]
MSKKIVISGYYGFDNFGDEGILGILVKNLKNMDIENLEITVLSSNPEKTAKRYDVKSVKNFNVPKVIDTLKDSDVLISGGGSLLQDATSVKSLAYYLWVIFMALFYKKKVIIFAQGIGPINNPIARFITKTLLKKVSYASVRDEKSLYLLRGWGINPELVNDPMWSLELLEKEPKNRIGIQLRDWKTLSDEFINSLARKVNENFKGYEIYLYSFQDSQDYEVCTKFKNFLSLLDQETKPVIIYQRTNQEMIDSFMNLDYLIAMRYHACILALKYGIPTLPVSYDEKVEKLAKELEIPYISLPDGDNLKNAVEGLKMFDCEKVKKKIEEKHFDFKPIFDIIEE